MQANSTYSQKTKISLELGNTTVETVLNEIESKTEFKFIFNTKTVDLNRRVSIKVKKASVEKILDILFKEMNVSYILEDRKILLKKIGINEAIEVTPSASTPTSKQFQVSGTIIDSEGSKLPGASIVEKGTTNGTQSDFDGNFIIDLTNDNAVLIISYIGFTTKEIPVNGQTNLTISLEESAAQLDEIVVTALGIKRDKKALGYSVSSVSSEEIIESGQANVINALQGKVAGLNITKGSGLSDASSSIVLRGNNSINGNNAALIVVDGVIYNNSTFGNNTVDRGQGISDLNTDDIESVTVLKGANASALYGGDGANGVLVITTKKQLKNKGVGVTVNSGVVFTEVATLPNLQNIYGQGKGEVGEFQGMGADGFPLIGGGTNDETWGPKMEGQPVRINWLRDQPLVPYSPQPNNIRDLFDTGVTFKNTVSISQATEKSTYYGSLVHNKADEYIPTAMTQKTGISLRVNHQLTSKLSVDAIFNYISSKGHNRPENNFSSSANFATHPRSLRLGDLRPGRYPESGIDWGRPDWQDGQPILWTTTENIDQYYWGLYVDSNDDSRKRSIGNFKLNYEFNNWLSLMLRHSFDETHYSNWEITQPKSRPIPNGRYSKQDAFQRNYSTDFLFMADKNFFDNRLNLNGTVGGIQNGFEGKFADFVGNSFVFEDVYTPNNTLSKSYNYNESRAVTNSLYGTLQLGYDSLFFLDFTGRNDWSSKLNTENNSYFYSSITSSLIFSEVFKLDKRLINFGKIRFSYAEVGNAVSASINRNYSFGNSTKGASFVSNPQTLPFLNLKPERTNSTEIGLDLNMLNNRIQLDATYYRTNSFNQIIPGQPLAISSGYTSKTINGGSVENKGLELSMTAYPIRNKDFTWETNVVYAKNKSKVIDLGGLDSPIILGGTNAVQIAVVPGESFRSIMGEGFLRNDQGLVIIKPDGSDRGVPLQTNEYINLGKVEPDWTGGIRNTFIYKNVSLGFQIDGSFGGNIFAETNMAYDEQGVSVSSLNGREGWIASENARKEAGISSSDWKNTGGVDLWIGKSVIFDPNLVNEEGVQIGGVLNEGTNAIYADPRTYWDRFRNDRAEGNIEDASFVKLREVNLAYRLPKRLLDKSPFSNVRFSVIGQNLWLLYRETEHFDPDAYRTGVGTGSLGYNDYTAPATRSVSFNVLLNF
ncbi:SusC/RagA family TonB-linked outer membrane protein [Arenibacter certesii]|uniref:SusC/RagA family TonB-linked outer membrane protein n=2 Tax=Arenibacter certesii TaxID=228955 RepID=A0A918J4V4_9FLAO|nr:SusC/RagA family TonB-linked outer membrane protein [Arenibacter certesii]GGW48511.1 SusC/RagA family TonB-linked outer membrane protein [Arenibacter certesii]